MGKTTNISWANSTYNFVRGCSPVSEGCRNCYAEAQAAVNPDVLGKWGSPRVGGTRVVAADRYWKDPLKWDAEAKANGVPSRVFTLSFGDVFEAWDGPMLDHKGHQLFVTRMGSWVTKQAGSVGDSSSWDPLTYDHCRERWLALVNRTPHLQWLVLTKRPENVMDTLVRVRELGRHDDKMVGSVVAARWNDGYPPANVWLGVSAEDQENFVQRVFWLSGLPARIRFVSAEPLLGPIDFRRWFSGDVLKSNPFDWLIAGGESGDLDVVRPCGVEWIRDLVTQCKEVGLPIWVKQLGSRPIMPPTADRGMIPLPLADPKGEDVGEWPEDLRVQELPDLTEASPENRP
jgi:protein gp37